MKKCYHQDYRIVEEDEMMKQSHLIIVLPFKDLEDSVREKEISQ